MSYPYGSTISYIKLGWCTVATNIPSATSVTTDVWWFSNSSSTIVVFDCPYTASTATECRTCSLRYRCLARFKRGKDC
jgi:hypothetical protein